MRPAKRPALPILALALLTAAVVTVGAAAAPPDDTSNRPHSQNMHLIGSSLRAGAVTGPWIVSAPETRGPTVHLDHLNPQTNQLSFTADSNK
jgi:hypothetical protein